MEKELAAFQASLDAEMKAEEERYQRNISTLGKRKEEMVKSRKEKLKVSCWDTVRLAGSSTIHSSFAGFINTGVSLCGVTIKKLSLPVRTVTET